MIQKLLIIGVMLLSMMFVAFADEVNETVNVTSEQIELNTTQTIDEILEDLSETMLNRLIPTPFSHIIGNERIEVIINTDNESQILYSFVSQDNVIQTIQKGEIENPTIGIEISESIIRDILDSDNQFEALKQAYQDKNIQIAGNGVWNSIKVGTVKTIANIILWFL